jgi:hypothetical protein
MTFAQQLAADLSNVLKAPKAKTKRSAPTPKAKPAKAAPAKAPATPVAGAQGSAKGTPRPQAAPKAPARGQAPTAQADAPGKPYTLGKPFVPKTGGKYSQAENWAVVAAMLPATKADLIAAIKAAAEVGGYADRCNANGFVQGRIRDGHIV